MVLERLGEEQLQHRRDDGGDLHTVLLGEREPRRRLEPPHQDGRGRLARMHADREQQQPVRVGQRERGQRPHDARHVAVVVAGLARAPQVLVREHHALRAAGRAAGVDERRQIVVGASDGRPRIGSRELVELRPERDHRLHARRVGRRLLDGRAEGVRGHDEARLGVDQDPAELIGRQEKDRGRHHAARAPDRLVMTPTSGPFSVITTTRSPGPQAPLAEAPGEVRRAAVQLAGSVHATLEREGGTVAVPLESGVGEAGEIVRSDGGAHSGKSMLRACPKQ